MNATTYPAAAPDQARRFRSLHRDGVLVLPNAWDAASAVLVAAAGAPAIATTSAGVAWSLGVPDGDRLSRTDAVAVVARVVASVGVPVSADVETGYGADAADVADTVSAVIGAGAAGINLEDSTGAGLRDVEEQAERLTAARRAADALGHGLFLNARTDVWLRPDESSGPRLAETMRRALRYVEAGADGVFVPGLTDLAHIRTLARELPVPVNVMAGPGSPPVSALAEAGARRVSVGMALAQAAYATAARAAAELLSDGTYATLAGGVPFAELQAAFRA